MRSFAFLCLTIVLGAPYSHAIAKTSILIFGDSLSSAYNIQQEKGWVILLEKKLVSTEYDVDFTNASISGETSSGGLARFLSQVDKTNPNIVILELGANDGLRGSSLITMRSNLKAMIEICQQNNISVILAGMHIPPNYGRTYTGKFDQIYLDLGKKAGLVGEVVNITQNIEFKSFCTSKASPFFSKSTNSEKNGLALLVQKPYIMNLDIDIFGPDGGMVDDDLKIKVIKKAMQNATAICIATSPGFIDQNLAKEKILSLTN